MSEAPPNSPGSMSSLSTGTFEKYSAALHRYLMKRLRRAEDVSDLTQEIFERFFKKRDRPEVIRNPLSYLFGIASHVISEARYEQQQDRLTYDSELVERLVDVPDDGPAAEMDTRIDMQRALLDALSTLPENHLLAVLLVECQGMSYDEAARASGFTRSTIATYLMHARAKLKLILQEEWGQGGSKR